MNLTTDVGTAIPLKVIGLAPKDITPGAQHLDGNSPTTSHQSLFSSVLKSCTKKKSTPFGMDFLSN
jgi:hypothetical protein